MVVEKEIVVQENYVEKEEGETMETKKRKLGGMKTMPFILGKLNSYFHSIIKRVKGETSN